jgi:DnaJ-class molecular chaperone
VTKWGDYHYIEGEGMPIRDTADQRGNLFVQYSIELPKVLTEEQKKVVRELFPQ